MAIDTKAKRLSCFGFVSGLKFAVLPEPDGTLGGPDKQHILGFYSGIAFGAPVLNDIYISFPPLITTLTMIFQPQTETSGGTVTDTTKLHLPIDFVMADTPPVIPIPAARPGPLRGPMLVNRIHLRT